MKTTGIRVSTSDIYNAINKGKAKQANFKPIDEDYFVNNPDLMLSTEEMCDRLEISPTCAKIGDLFQVRLNDTGIDLATDAFQKDLDTRVAKDYEKRLSRIKELVLNTPELKGKEQELVKKLDDIYESKFKKMAANYTELYRGIADSANHARKHLSDIFGVEYEKKESLDKTTKKEIESDFMNFFKEITSRIKEGASADDIKGLSLSTNKHVKSFSAIRQEHEQSSLVLEYSFELEIKAMNYFLRGDISKEEMFSDLTSILENLDSEFDKFKLQGAGNGHIKNTFNFDKILMSIQNKL